MPGPRRNDPGLHSAEEIVYREYGGLPPRLSAAAEAAAPAPELRAAWGAALDIAEAPPGWPVLPILGALLVLADFALASQGILS